MNPQCPDPTCERGWIPIKLSEEVEGGSYDLSGERTRKRCPNPVHATPAAEHKSWELVWGTNGQHEASWTCFCSIGHDHHYDLTAPAQPEQKS